jgi:hypothetical protein
MLSTIAYATKSAQICPKLPKTAQNCQETITSRNFEIPPKIEVLDFFKKKLPYVEEAPKHEHTIWIFNLRIFHMPF